MTPPKIPGIQDLIDYGERPALELQNWLTTEHAWLPEGTTAQETWDQALDTIEARWGEHVAFVSAQ